MLVRHDATHEVNLLAVALRTHADRATPRAMEGWQNAPLNILDCVLSLNRPYERFCLPRVRRFNERHAEVQELAVFRELILSYPTPLEFSVVELEYRDERRAKILLGVTAYVARVLDAFPATGDTLSGPEVEMARLNAWARTVKPSDAWSTGVYGFGLAGFQYLRMLFGMQTAKPDIHMQRFVSAVIGRRVSDYESLTLLEAAATQENLPLADLDYSIWRERSGAKYEEPQRALSPRVQNSACRKVR